MTTLATSALITRIQDNVVVQRPVFRLLVNLCVYVINAISIYLGSRPIRVGSLFLLPTKETFIVYYIRLLLSRSSVRIATGVFNTLPA